MQENSKINDFSAMAENDLLDFKGKWREFCDHSYFRDLTSNQRRLKSELTWISNFAWRKFASTRTVMQPFWTHGPKT